MTRSPGEQRRLLEVFETEVSSELKAEQTLTKAQGIVAQMPSLQSRVSWQKILSTKSQVDMWEPENNNHKIPEV